VNTTREIARIAGWANDITARRGRGEEVARQAAARRRAQGLPVDLPVRAHPRGRATLARIVELEAAEQRTEACDGA
jgi:hypothetical protein